MAHSDSGANRDFNKSRSFSVVSFNNQYKLGARNINEKSGAYLDVSESDLSGKSITGEDAGEKYLAALQGEASHLDYVGSIPDFYFDRHNAAHLNRLTTTSINSSSSRTHLQSAEVFETFSPFQVERGRWLPQLPISYNEGLSHAVERDAPEDLPKLCLEELKCFLPTLHHSTHYFEMEKLDMNLELESKGSIMKSIRAIRVGIIMSGGPAPGGHNVISGLFDFVKARSPGSDLIGFMGGIDGMLHMHYEVISSERMDSFRNQGGFDMLSSGRGKFHGDEDFEKALEICKQLHLDGLVIVGGDGSNSNAALLAEYFQKKEATCCVVGIPKTIDGDLKNSVIELSFGFDTAAKTYSELIGSLCNDARTAQKTYHFVRVMGRSASHLVLECALQVRPNLAFIGEEIEAEKITLQQVVEKIVTVISARRRQGKNFGVILLPEGLIESFPEMKCLFRELNELLASGTFDKGSLHASREIWEYLPEVIQQQLLLDREASGYIQVAKIATERLLILLVTAKIEKLGWSDDIEFVPHYFGYEGRCAMPSNFDASYCYTLGYNAGTLIENGRNGYMSVVRELRKPVEEWKCAGVPFWQLMNVSYDMHKTPFPSITRQLVNLEDDLFHTFKKARDIWEVHDCYCYPGPIQFEGPLAECRCCTLMKPSLEDLTSPFTSDMEKIYSDLLGRPPLCMSQLQKRRLKYRPAIPPLCTESLAKAVVGNQVVSEDPYTKRQIGLQYPYMTNRNRHTQVEIVKGDRHFEKKQLQQCCVGIVFLSRQFPGAMNVLWGLYERVKRLGGKLYAFYGICGLLERDSIEITSDVLDVYYNAGGIEPIGRSTEHSFLTKAEMDRICKTCDAMKLNGLVLPGSAFVSTLASLLCEYFLSKRSKTLIVGVPCTGSNNMSHELIETCVGFDSSTKVYASLIGNVLTDAASMPKYWHFIRLMGRQPSHEVLECALQTHPNIVIIGEEYGASDKTMRDVVNDIADVVVKRSEMGKNFGTVLIPDALLMHLPNMKVLLTDIGRILTEARQQKQLKVAQRELLDIDVDSTGIWAKQLSPWNMALLKSFPEFARAELVEINLGEVSFERLETEELLAQMVKKELEDRKRKNQYKGKFAAITHFFGYQGRSAPPSLFDATLAFAYGHLAAILIENGLTGYCCSIRGLCGKVSEWKCSAISFTSLMKIVPTHQLVHADIDASPVKELPVIPSAEVNLKGKAFRAMKLAISQWSEQDRFCNPGPMQFYGKASYFYSRTLFEEHSEYFNMLRQVEYYTLLLLDTCKFGVSKDFLREAFVLLNGLLVLSSHTSDLPSILPYLGDIDNYNNWKDQLITEEKGDASLEFRKNLSSLLSSRTHSIRLSPVQDELATSSTSQNNHEDSA